VKISRVRIPRPSLVAPWDPIPDRAVYAKVLPLPALEFEDGSGLAGE
jgi:hypothetical protein